MATVQELLDPPISGEASIDGVLGSYVRWEAGPADHAFRYSFSIDAESATGTAVQPFNEAEMAATRLILTQIGAITGIEFIEIADGDAAQLTFLNDDYNGAYFATRSDMAVDGNLQVTHYVPEGSVVISNNTRAAFTDTYANSGYSYQLLMHEIGHALDLKHPHDGWVMLEPAVDSNLHSVMTYQGGIGARADYPDYDVAALLWRYGTDGLGGEGAWTYGAANLYGTLDGNDRVRGGPAAEYLYGNGGADTLIGRGGNDILVGASGADTMNGGAGNDSYVVNDDDMLIDAGGIDTVFAFNSWTLADGFENLRLNESLSSTQPFSAAGNGVANLITGNAGANAIAGLDGDDTLYGLAGADSIAGGPGDDLIVGGYDNDDLSGGEGADRFLFTQPSAGHADQIADFHTGVDQLHLDASQISFLGAGGQFAADDSRFYGAAGATSGHDADDRIIFNSSTGQLFWDGDGSGSVYTGLLFATVLPTASVAATDIWIDAASAPGTTFAGTSGSDTLAGGDGNDRLDGLAGADDMSGGTGNDTYVVTAGDVVSDSGGVDWIYSSEGSWRLGGGFENLALILGGPATKGTGNALDNRMVGNQLANTLVGLGGDDTLLGGGGADKLHGRAGNDSLTGGTGNDHFVFAQSGSADADIVMDFGNGNDVLQVDSRGFATIGAAGAFAADDPRFYAAPGADHGHDGTDRLVYDTSSGRLYYDADGSGGEAPSLVATLTGHPVLAAGDIVVT